MINDYQKALDQLVELVTDEESVCALTESRNALQKLVDKTNPLKVLNIDIDTNVYYGDLTSGTCPSCGHEVSIEEKHCPNCMQALDWSGWREEGKQ